MTQNNVARPDVQVDESRLKLLSEVAYAAILADVPGDQAHIFELLREQCPDNAVGYIGDAMLLLKAGQHDDAITLLEEKALTARINLPNAEAVHLFSLYVAGRKDDARCKAIEFVKNRDEGTPAHNMAQALFALGDALGETDESAMPFSGAGNMPSDQDTSRRAGQPFVPGMM